MLRVWVADWNVDVEPDGLVITTCPFRGPRRAIPVSQVEQVLVWWAPPTVRLRSGEYVFVPAPKARELADLATRHAVPFVQRVDVWSLILDEFLDTELDEAQKARSMATLAQNGIPRDEVRGLRALVSTRMMALTALSWEWGSYGLFDVLSAMKVAPGSGFFTRAMSLADRGAVKPSTREEFLRVFPEKPAR